MCFTVLDNFSDDQADFLISDHLLIMRFLGLVLGDNVPDAKTIWLYREHLVKAGAINKLFDRFDKYLDRTGYLAMGGKIVDATVERAPVQRKTDEEKKDIKAGRIPKDSQDKPAKLRQKDRDARWTVKFSKARVDENGQAHKRDIAIPAFGYKNHIAIDKRHGYIRFYTTTPASAYDGTQLRHVLRKDNMAPKVWADTAYRSKGNEEWLKDNGLSSDVHRKKTKGKPMNKATSRANNRRSKVRTKVEHVFAHIKGGVRLLIRTIGISRAHLKIGMANLVYNLKRNVWHEAKATRT